MGRGVSDQQGSKIQGNALPEIFDAWQQAALDLRREPEIVEAARGTLRAGNLLVAWVLAILAKSDEERIKESAQGLRMLERLKESDVPIDLRKISRQDFGLMGANPDDTNVSPRRPRSGRVDNGGDAKRPAKRTG